jgi:copper chaperone
MTRGQTTGRARRGQVLSEVIPYRGMSDSITYAVPGMHCDHCVAAVEQELSAVAGVESVDVDLATKRVVVTGDALDDGALRAAIDEAGYDAERA